MEVRLFYSDLKEGLLFVFLSCPLLGQSFPSLAPLPEWNLKAAYFTISKFRLYALNWITSSLAHNQLFPCASSLLSPLHFYALEKNYFLLHAPGLSCHKRGYDHWIHINNLNRPRTRSLQLKISQGAKLYPNR